jgi:predicted ATPase
MYYKQNGYIITGGPGAGKTSVLDVLQQQGNHVMPEVARDIIREQMAIDGPALPWRDTFLYKRIMGEKTIQAFHAAPETICFFDRGIPDVIAYGKLIGAPEDHVLEEAVRTHRCNQQVFIFPPWKEIYTTDTERKQDFTEAIATYNIIKETYVECGYELIEVYFGTMQERAAFIAGRVQTRN